MLRVAVALSFILCATVLRGQDELTVRVLPQPVSSNRLALTLGFQVGLLEGAGNPFRAECFQNETLGGDAFISVRPAGGSARDGVVVSNEDGRPHAVSLTTRILRRGIGHTVRVVGRRVKGNGSLRVLFSPVAGRPEEAAERSVSFKGEELSEKRFAVTPLRDGVCRCTFELEPGAVLEFRSFSLMPDDAEQGWDPQPLEALRGISAKTMRWPAQRGLGFYNWYDGVGPKALRRAVSPTAREEDGHDFGTVEFVGFCRLAGAEPVMRVTVYVPGVRDERVPDLAAGIQLAADWAAYCNATGGHPLAVLRARHGCPEPLGVRRWELVTPEGGAPADEVVQAYAAALRAESPGVAVGAAPACLSPAYDRYVETVMRRLSAAEAAEREYYRGWYETLGLAFAAVERLRRGEGGEACTPYRPEEVLFRVPYAKSMVTEKGHMMALFNRFPAAQPLVTQAASESADAAFRVQAAWMAEASALVVFVYNAGPMARTLKVDLTALRRRFGFWVADQLAADISARRSTGTVPVNRIQKAGAALTQCFLCEVEPSSFTRVIVKE